MKYDKVLLKSWTEMETYYQFLERNGAFNNVSKEVWRHIEQQYFRIVKQRIEYCRRLLAEHDDFFIYYTLAELSSRGNLDGSSEYLFQRPVRFYAIKAIRKNPYYAPAWALLAGAYRWLACLGREGKSMPKMKATLGENDIAVEIDKGARQEWAANESIRFVEKAIRCLKKAVALDPGNDKYQSSLKKCYYFRAEEDELLGS